MGSKGKKKVLIEDLDLGDIRAEGRSAAIDRLAGSTQAYLEARYPDAEGYKHKRWEVKPYEKQPHLVATSLAVQRGRSWGYTVSFMPVDTESQTVRVTLSTNPRLFDIVAASALVLIVVLVALLFATGTIAIDLKSVKDPVFAFFMGFALLIGLWAALTGILWLPVRSLMSRNIDQEAQEREMDDLSGGIRELLVMPASQR